MDISETIKFKDICIMLDKVKKAANIAAKEKYVRRYYESFSKYREEYRSQNGIELEEESGASSFYCVLRCLIPGSDNARVPYGLQINSLGKVYIKVLQLAGDSREAERLQARSYSGIHGDYADIVYSVLLPRCQRDASSLNLKEVHEMLDKIAADDRRNTEKVLTRLSEIASPREQKWFIRLLLKSMHLGIGEQRIFGVLHPQAKALYQRISSLGRVCNLLANNKFSEENSTDDVKPNLNLNELIEPFQHIQPMLCEVFPGNIERLMEADLLYMETKMDGERFQLHFANGRFKYISRNGVDYTYSFGDNYNSGHLTPDLENLLPIGMQSIILDGEMMVWDTQQKRFRDKGENTDVKHLSGNSGWRPCFVVYDLLYLNGRSLLSMPYVQRTYKLKELIKEQPGVLLLMKPVKVTSMEEFKRLFQLALDSNEEGVVVKKQNALYQPGVRYGGGWFKVKADYIEGLTTEFDLLIMGGFYNRTRTFIDSYLLGVLKHNSAEQYEVYSIGKVANVIRQRVPLNESLKPHWRLLDTEPPPMWYRYSDRSPEGRPDVWIDPRNSTIVQIKAADLAPSGAFYLNKSLHFPRIQAWRNDKVWNECMTLRDFNQMSQGNKGLKKINKREVNLEDFTRDRKRLKLTPAQKRKVGLEAYNKKFDADEIEKTSDFFAGFSFCILSASVTKRCTVEELKALVVRNGGEIVENPIQQDPKCICVAGDITYRVQTLQKLRRYNIVSITWLLRMCDEQQMELTPKDMICMTDDLQAQFAEMYDKNGDSDTGLGNLGEVKEEVHDISEEELASSELTDGLTENFYSNCLACFYSANDRAHLAKLQFQERGGRVVDTSNASQAKDIAYVFITPNDIDSLVFKQWLSDFFTHHLNNVNVVNINWVLDSHNAGRLLDVCEYTCRDF